MAPAPAGPLDEAYSRLHRTGPEFHGWLSNHGPMAAEAMVRRGHGAEVTPWLDQYMRRLEDFPRGLAPIDSDWRSALGDVRRVADWTGYFQIQMRERPWKDVLNDWWPRLLPGVVAAATHGVIRVGHSVRCLLADGDDDIRTSELAHGLAYWAARWQTIPAGHAGATAAAAAAAGRAGSTSLAELLAGVPRIADQSGDIRDRLDRLGDVAGWLTPLDRLTTPTDVEQIRALLTELVDAATVRYLRFGHGNGIMLVHSATAPNAILRTLPALESQLWAQSLTAAWAASSALTAIYAPAEAMPSRLGQLPDSDLAAGADISAETFGQAVEHGDEHVIKFADTAVDVFARTGDPDAVGAAQRAMKLIERP